MHKRMKELAQGNFECVTPHLILDKEISLHVYEDEVYEGEFTIETESNVQIRGFVYVTNPRMEIQNPQFEGSKISISYRFCANGLSEGMTEKGDFIIVCNQNESTLSFCVSVSKRYAKTSIGSVKNLYDFLCLAKENWGECSQLFYHKNFSKIITSGEVRERMIYRGMIAAKPSHQSIEEFLIAIRKKERINFWTEETNVSVYAVTETVKQSVELKKDNWGYIEITASADAKFIRLEKTLIRSDDFIGSICHFDFFIEPDYLHNGKNFGKIELSDHYETITIRVEASLEEKREERECLYLQRKKYRVKLTKLYEAYRLKRMITGAWAKESIAILTQLQELEPNEPIYALMKAQCFLINRQKQEAEWILDEFKRAWTDKSTPIWGYYLYLITLMEKEPIYVERMIKEIESIFLKHSDSILLFWVLTFLRDSYVDNNALKLKDIEYQIMTKTTSPYLYIEAFYLIWQEPYLLTKLDEFEIRILRWAVRQRVLTEDIAIRIFQIMETKKHFDPVLYKIMCAAYEVSEKTEYVGIICGYLIKGQKYDKKYHKWYELGITSELRITGLYEAYLLSMDERQITPVPKIIQMYFQYDCRLPYQKMAVLYDNIIASKTTNLEVYQKYCKTMSDFAIKQILEGHMDDGLSIVYDDMLDLGVINEELAHALSHIIFTQKLTVFDANMLRVIVYQKQLKEPQVVPIINKTAYVSIYSEDYVLIFEDAGGYRYCGSISYHLEKLIEPQKYLKKCMEFAPFELPYLIFYFDKRQTHLAFEKEDERYFPVLMSKEAISDTYKAHFLPEILRFYQMREEDGAIKEYLEQADYKKMDEASRKFIIETAVEHRFFSFAYEKIKEYGIDQIGSGAKAALATDRITNYPCEKEDVLLALTISAFRGGKYNHAMLNYLCQHYEGATKEMMNIWFEAKKSDIDLLAISGRILQQILYTGDMILDAMPIFSYFHEAGGDDVTLLAYISVLSHLYFVKKQDINREIFELIEERHTCHMELNDVCKLALLSYYADLSEISEKQFMIEDELLGEYTQRTMYFAFYKQLAPELVLKYHLYDKVFLEYSTNSNHKVILHYSRDEDEGVFLEEEMQNVYDGIFVSSFILFFGEAIQYYITEEGEDGQEQVVERNRVTNSDVYNRKDKSRYNLLNQMLISDVLQEETELQMTMKEYASLEKITKQMFGLL